MVTGTSQAEARAPLRRWLFGILLLAFGLRLAFAFSVPSVAYPDEHFQTLEPAHRLAYGYGVVTWEWREGIRSWAFPALVAGLMRATQWMGAGSSGYLTAITLLLSLVSLTAVWFAFRWTQSARGDGGVPDARNGRRADVAPAMIAGLGCAAWFDLVYFAPHPLAEVVAAHVLLPALWIGAYGTGMSERRRMLLAGFGCGLAVALRMQLAPAVVVAALYFCGRDGRRDWRGKVPWLALGMALPLGVFGMVDWATWGLPFQSFWMNFAQNVIAGRSLIYGTAPWYRYLALLFDRSGAVLLLAAVGTRRSPFLGAIAAVMIASHSVFAHKEFRFIYPVLPILVTLAALGVAEIAGAVAGLAARGKKAGEPSASTQANAGESPASTQTAASSSRLVLVVGLAIILITSVLFGWRVLPYLHNAGGRQAMQRLSRDAGVCGVGLAGVPWQTSGGYSALHRNVPLLIDLPEREIAQEAESFNALLINQQWSRPEARFTLQGCRDGVCTYRRAGGCAARTSQYEVNAVLRRTGK